MLTKIIDFSIRNKLIVGLFTIALIAYGSYQITQLPIDAVPDITDNQVQIITSSPALAAPEVERLITSPIEQSNNNIPGLKQIRSFSRFGLSVVTLVFEDKTDVYWARQQVNERLRQVQEQIPKGFGSPELAPVTTGLGEIYQYTVRPKPGYEGKYNAMELRTIQDWIVRRQLLSVKGVAEVSSFGGMLKQYEIAVNPDKLKSYNITIQDIFSALERNNQNTGGAYIEKGPTVLFIRSEGLVGSMDDINNIVIKNLSNGTPLLVRDVAEVGLGHATRYGAMTYNGKQQVSGAVVMMLKGANSNEVIKNIKERITKIQKMLPEGVIIDPFLDRTKMVNNSIHTVSKNLLEGALIVIFVLVLFLGNLRAGFLVASVIPLSMLFAIILMNLFGVSGNLMSLGALDFGLIVDGAVIIVEAVMHSLTHKKVLRKVNRLSAEEMDEEVHQSASRMMNSAVFGQIIILIVYLPIFTLQGIEGKMFKPMAQTVAFALLGAFLLSLTYVPMMSTLIISKKLSHKKNFSERFMLKVERFYEKFLLKALQIPKLILGATVLLFVLSMLLLTRIGGEFIPSLPEGDYAVETRVLPGSNLNTSIDAVSKASKILLEKFPEVRKVVGKTGSSEVPTDPMPIDATDMMVILKDRSEWTSAKTYDELEAKMSKALEAIPGVSFGFQYPVAMRFNELISGARQDVVCKIFGDDLDTLSVYAKKLGEICKSVDGSSGLYVEAVTGMPQIVIHYNRHTIAQYGLNISDINRTVKAAFAGESSGMVFEGEKRFEMVVRLAGDQRRNLQDVQNLLIATPGGTQIPLYQVATVEVMEGPNQIQRENAQRRIIVGFNVRGRDIQGMVKELQQKAEKQLKLPAGYYITYGGAFENLEAAKKRLSIAVPVSLLLIFLMLYFAFNSIKHGLLIFSAIPLSAIGGIIGLSARSIPFSISAGIGFIALFGVAVLNGIVLLAEFNNLKHSFPDDLRKVVIRGTVTRLRPVLMTAMVASLGFLPMALSQGEGAEVQRPLATVVIGGLMLATLLTLFVLPILYMLFEERFVAHPTQLSPIPVLLLLLWAADAKAQTPIHLSAAIDTAVKNNLLVRHERLKADYQKALIHSGASVAPLMLSTEVGQLNSIYVDTKFGISQAFSFPKVYASSKNFMTEEWKGKVLYSGIQESELKKQVALVYYDLLYLRLKQKLLQKNDSMFASLVEKSEQRFQSGETNILEKTAAEQQRMQVKLQMMQVEQDLGIKQLQFQLLLNTEETLVPIEEEFLSPSAPQTDSSRLSLHPASQYLQQRESVSAAEIKMEKAKLLPDITLSYGAMSIRGTGPDNRNYNAAPRFQFGGIGFGIPAFTRAQKAKISAAQTGVQLARSELDWNREQLRSSYNTALLHYQQYSEMLRYYESTALKNAEVIRTTADKQFSGGDINYLEWVLLSNQAIGIESDYIETLKKRNESIVEINNLLSEQK